MQIGIIEPMHFSKKAISALKLIGNVNFFNQDECNLIDFLKDQNIIFVRLKYFFGEDLLRDVNKLNYICSPTTGHNHIDCDYIKSKKIQLISLKNESNFLKTIRATPEHAFGLVLSLLRNYQIAFCTNKIEFADRDMYKGEEIYKKNIGLIGFGRVGQLLAKYFISFGAKIAYYDTKDIEFSEDVIRMDSIELLIENSDIIILCASYSLSNIGIINELMLDLMKDKYFVNIARGELVNEEIMLEKLQHMHFKGLALDVLSNENGSHNFKKFKKYSNTTNTIITPHIAGATLESMTRTEEFIVQKLNSNLEND
jgi:D-3-phosphoglycerate dehydrogenase / 2-oxoglutarate reductase